MLKKETKKKTLDLPSKRMVQGFLKSLKLCLGCQLLDTGFQTAKCFLFA